MKRKLLSILLTFCLAFSLLPTAALADEGKVAKVGDTEYTTLQAAIDAAKSGETVTLLANINTPTTSYVIRKSLTIDLNSQTITADGYDSVFAIEGEGNHVVINATNGGKVIAVENSGSAGKYAMAVWLAGKNSTLTINGGEFSQSITSMSDPQMDMIYTSKGVITINGGTFRSGTPKWTLNIKDSAYKDGSANIIVNGGEFVGYDPRNAENEGKGTSLVADGVGINKDAAGNFTAVPNMAAQIVDAAGNSVAAYADHNAAIEAAVDGNTVKLLKDAELTETLKINKAITLDGANHKITGKSSTGKTSFITVKTDGDFTMKNATILPTSKVEANAAIDLQVKGKVVVDNCVFGAADDTNQFMYNGLEFSQSEAYPMADGTTISNCTFYGGSFRHNFISFYRMADGATININGNKFLNANWDTTNAIRVSNYSNVSATINLLDNTYNDRGADKNKGYAGLLIFQETSDKHDNFTTLTVNIENLDTTGAQSNQLFYVYKDGAGIISTNQPVVKGDSSIEKFFVAKVDDTYYKTLAAAVAALPYNTDNTAPAATTTIKLLCDTNGGFDFGDGPSKVVNASLDLNNNTLTLGPAIGSTNTETNGIRVLAYSKLEIKNGTIKCSDEVSNNGRKVKVGLANYGTAVLEDIVFKSGTYDIWTVNNRGDLTLKGNTTVETGTNSDTTDNPTLTRAAINNTPYDYFYDGVNAVINVADATVEVGKIVLNDETISASINTNGKAVLNLSAGTFGEISETKPGNGIEGNITGGKFSSDPSVYVVGNGNTNIVKRDGSEGAYTYTVLAKSGLTSGVYLTDPSGALASNYYVSSTANGVWTVSYSAPYSGGSSSYDPTYSVSTPSKTEHGTVTVSPKSASKGDTVTVTVKPDSGYVLETLTVTDKNGNELTLKDKGNGKYTFTMPAGKVEVKATFMEDNSMLNFFYDVPNNAYFYEAVKWAVKNGITTGVGNNLFAPEQPCTRAQIVTFLWRAAGSPEPKGAASGMSDVVSGSYYEKAVAWAIENGITTGTTTSTFSPDATCTRAQAVTFLARALKAKAASAAEFSDVPTGSYFADAVAWAAANGVTEGIGGGLFGSDNDCTRGQIVTFLYRAYNK